MENKSDLLTKQEASEYLRVSTSTLFRNKEVLPKTIKIGTKVFYRLSQLNAWLDKQQNAK